MKRWFLRFLGIEYEFKKEFKAQLRMFILITLGFTIAFTWRQTVFDLSLQFVKLLTNLKDSSALSIFASMFLTLLSLFLIYFSSHWLKGD